MNLNVKLDGEEEQTLQYVNRFAINIPSNGAAFNLNVVNSGLSNQSYILNPVSPVAQNIVTYQQPMTLQSFIALPTESDGNIIHGLPVGMSVPIGIPVTTGLLQNHNYVNTGIIIGNEDCNPSGVLKPTTDTITSEDDLKITYVQKPLDDLTATITNAETVEPHDIGLNCSSQVNSEIDGKKSCPLEMSIKAANIDMECGPMVTVILEDRSLEVEGPQLVDENMPFRELKDDSLEVPLELPSTEKPNGHEVLSENGETKKQKTEITWENNNIKGQENSNDFQESLICEVEEVNDDEDEEAEEEEEEEERGVDGDGETENVGEDEEAVEAVEENEVESTSLEENDTLPLSLVLKIRKRTSSRKNENGCREKRRTRSGGGRNSITNNSSDHNKIVNKRNQRLKKSVEASNCDSEWSESDDDVLNLTRIKNEFNYKCFYETKTTKSTNSSLSKVDDKCKKFVKVRSCCSKLECAKKISAKDQKAAHKMFYELESDVKRDAYLMNCIEHVQRAKVKERNSIGERKWDSENRKSFMTTNIQLEIENESNGNQKLSDEIQNAINESLKDCIASESGSEMNTLNEVNSDDEKNRNCEKSEKHNWNFYIVIDRCRKRVCLQFLIKVFRITKTRIKNLQKNILSGTPLAEDSNFVRSSQKGQEIREIVKTHLDSLATEECIDCNANPQHRFLSDWCTREYLFDIFKDFYSRKIGREPNIKYASYKRFLSNETVLSFLKKKDGICTECEDLRKRQKRKLNKASKEKSKCIKSPSNADNSSMKSKKWPSGCNSSEDSSDDEPLAKHRKLKLSKLNHGGSKGSKSQREKSGKQNSKNSTEKKSKTKLSKEKSKQSVIRGRDVWSLMLLHLETMPYKECGKCVNKKKHRFLDPTLTTQGLFEDYRKYFLKETNSELGLGFTMYEKYFLRNCNYTIMEVDVNASKCPRCVLDGSKT